jgi:hypothetical protein
MSPDLIVLGGLFLLRFGVPLLLILGGGYLAARYVESRRAAQRQRRSQSGEDAEAEAKRKQRAA